MDMKSALKLRVGDPVNVPHMHPPKGWKISAIRIKMTAESPSGDYPLFSVTHSDSGVADVDHITYTFLQEVS